MYETRGLLVCRMCNFDYVSSKKTIVFKNMCVQAPMVIAGANYLCSMDESLPSLYAKADALRHEIEDRAVEDLQVLHEWRELTSRTKFKRASASTSGANSSSNN